MNVSEILFSLYPFTVTVLYLFTLIPAVFIYFFRAFMLYTGKRRLDLFLFGPINTPNPYGKHMKNIFLHVFLAFFLSRILILIIGQVGFMLEGKMTHLFDFRKFIYTQWDASHYIGIAENGYTNVGDRRLHIVFYPLFPMLVRLLNFLTNDSLISSAILSNVALILGSVFLYFLSFDAYGEKNARISVWLFMFSMGAVFYSLPYTESLFFLLTVLCIYFARKRRFYLAIFMGALCSMTRLPGAITAVPVFFELIRSRLGYIRRIGEEESRIRRAMKVILKSFLLCLLILTGFFVYLLINRIVTGDAFKFLEYQKNHWGQEAGSICKTAEYTIRYLINPFVEWYRLGVYLPQTVAIFLVVFIVFCVKKDAHPSDLAYSVVYLFVTLSPTMLISGPRYLSAMYCLYPFAWLIMKRNRFFRYLLLTIWILFFVYSSYMFMVKWTYL